MVITIKYLQYQLPSVRGGDTEDEADEDDNRHADDDCDANNDNDNDYDDNSPPASCIGSVIVQVSIFIDIANVVIHTIHAPTA